MGRGRILLLVVLAAALLYLIAVFSVEDASVLNLAPRSGGPCVKVDDEDPLGVRDFRSALESANATGNGFVERDAAIRASLRVLEAASEEQLGEGHGAIQCVEWRGGNHTSALIVARGVVR